MITLTKNKILYSRESLHNNNEKEVDSIVPYLSDIIKIEEDVTLYDFFMMLEKDRELVSVIFSSCMSGVTLDPFLDEIKKDCLEEGQEDEIYHLECSWSIDQFNYKEFYKQHKKDGPIFPDENLKEPSGNEETEISIGVNFCGVGKFNGVNDGYGIEFTPLYRLKHLPLKLNTEFKMFKPNKFDGKPVASGYMEFTVFEVVSEILSEVTFRGSPENRDEEWNIILEEHKEMKDMLDNDKKGDK